MYIHIYKYTYVHVYICIYTYIHIYVYTYMYIYIHKYVRVHMNICIYTYTNTYVAAGTRHKSTVLKHAMPICQFLSVSTSPITVPAAASSPPIPSLSPLLSRRLRACGCSRPFS